MAADMLGLSIFMFLGLAQGRMFLDESKIVGGMPVPIEQAPYQVSLRQSSHVCGGTIVSERHVITAAHCVQGSGYSIRVGTDSLTSGGATYVVDRIFVHPNYSDLDFDVAVVRLNRSLEFGPKVARVDMILADLKIPEGKLVQVVGWGVTQEGGWFLSDQLRKVTVPSVSEERCARMYRDIVSITSRMLCAGPEVGGKDACQGDSGGGLTYNGTLAGIVSFGLGCARPGYPGVYSRVATLRPWIDQVMTS